MACWPGPPVTQAIRRLLVRSGNGSDSGNNKEPHDPRVRKRLVKSFKIVVLFQGPSKQNNLCLTRLYFLCLLLPRTKWNGTLYTGGLCDLVCNGDSEDIWLANYPNLWDWQDSSVLEPWSVREVICMWQFGIHMCVHPGGFKAELLWVFIRYLHL